MTRRLALFPGTFDPLTNGHLNILKRGLALFDEILITVTINVRKKPVFSPEHRMELIRTCFPGDTRIQVDRLEGLLAEFARERGACAILRGLRSPSDFEYELQMSQMNRHLNPSLETVFLTAEAHESYVSSSLVKEVASLGGDISELVPPHVAEALDAHYRS